jgi:hypothetical protein
MQASGKHNRKRVDSPHGYVLGRSNDIARTEDAASGMEAGTAGSLSSSL